MSAGRFLQFDRQPPPFILLIPFNPQSEPTSLSLFLSASSTNTVTYVCSTLLFFDRRFDFFGRHLEIGQAKVVFHFGNTQQTDAKSTLDRKKRTRLFVMQFDFNFVFSRNDLFGRPILMSLKRFDPQSQESFAIPLTHHSHRESGSPNI